MGKGKAQIIGRSHLSTLQLDSFNKAGSKGSGRLSRLFSARKSPRNSVASPGVSVQTSSPSVGPLTVDDMLTYQGGVSSSHPLLLYFLRRLCPSMQHFCTPLALPRNHSMYHRRVGLSSKLLMLLHCIALHIVMPEVFVCRTTWSHHRDHPLHC